MEKRCRFICRRVLKSIRCAFDIAFRVVAVSHRTRSLQPTQCVIAEVYGGCDALIGGSGVEAKFEFFRHGETITGRFTAIVRCNVPKP